MRFLYGGGGKPSDTQEFQQQLRSSGLFQKDVMRDGNCLFRAIADQLEDNEQAHLKYWELAINYLSRNKSVFASFLPKGHDIDEYIQKVNHDGTPGDHFELLALCASLNIQISLHLPNKNPILIQDPFHISNTKRTLHLAYFADKHYASVKKLEDYNQDEKLPLMNISDTPPEVYDQSKLEGKSTYRLTKRGLLDKRCKANRICLESISDTCDQWDKPMNPFNHLSLTIHFSTQKIEILKKHDVKSSKTS